MFYLDKIKVIIIKLFDILKTEYLPYRYYFVLLIIFIITFTWDMLTVSRLLRFIITCLVLIIYKKIQIYIESQEFSHSNIKYLKYWMWLNIIQNPILYIIWKWDVYIYSKLDELISNKFIKIILVNISLPFKIIYLRFYTILNIIKISTFQEFMFSRIYGFIISVLIFSNILKYIYVITGGPFYAIIYIYLIMYLINVIFTIYYYFNKDKKIKNTNTKIIKLLEKTIIYKIVKDYIDKLMVIEISEVYAYRIQATIVGNYIKKHINEKTLINLDLDIEKISEPWRFWINDNRIRYHKFKLWYISYKDHEIQLKITNYKIEHMFKQINFNKNYKYLDKYHDTYLNTIHSLNDLFEVFESVLYYKYYVYEKGREKYYDTDAIPYINKEEYANIYRMYLLIVKNILFFIWSFEYYILKDKTKITKLYVIENIHLEYGYHIYNKDIKEYDPYDSFKLLVWEKDFPKDTKNYWNENAYIINESIHLLLNLIFDVSDYNLLVYIDNQNNKQLKNIIKIHQKYVRKFSIQENNVALFKPEIAQKYFTELKNIIAEFEKEWERSYMNEKEILEKRQVLLELINYLKQICV